MLEFACTSCGKRVQGDDAFAGQHVLCPFCSATMTAPQRRGTEPPRELPAAGAAVLAQRHQRPKWILRKSPPELPAADAAAGAAHA